MIGTSDDVNWWINACVLWRSFIKLFTDLSQALAKTLGTILVCIYLVSAEWLFTATFLHRSTLNSREHFVSEMNSLMKRIVLLSILYDVVCHWGFKRPFIVAILIVVSSLIGYGVLYLNIPHLTWSLLASYLVGLGMSIYDAWSVYVFLADVDEEYGRRREIFVVRWLWWVNETHMMIFCLGLSIDLVWVRHSSSINECDKCN